MSAVEEFTTLTDDEVNALLAGSKQKGQYDAELSRFVESGQRGIKYPSDSGRFAGKAASSVKTGFTNAIKRAELSGQVRVIGAEDGVVLVNTQAAQG